MASLLPPNATLQERAIEGATARISDIPVPLRSLWDPDTCPASHLPWLAWALSVDVWDPAWPESRKRKAIKAAYPVHARKGTVGAVRRALAALDYEGIGISEWWQWAGDPGRFRVDVEVYDRAVGEAEIAAATTTVMATKNVRSHLDRLRVFLAGRGPAPAAAISTLGQSITVLPPSLAGLDATPGALIAAGAASVGQSITVQPGA